MGIAIPAMAWVSVSRDRLSIARSGAAAKAVAVGASDTDMTMARAGLTGSYGPRHRAPKPFKLVPPDPTEDQLQASIADLLEWILPEEVAWSHFPAGGYQLTKAAQARLFRLGLKRGFPDIMICYGRLKMLWLEVKTPTGTLTKAQKARHAQLQALGHVVVVVRSVEQALQALRTYAVPIRTARLDRSYHGTAEGDAGATQVSAARVAQKPTPQLEIPP